MIKPKGVKNPLDYQRFCNALENNPHSVGVVYRDNDDKLKIERFIKPSVSKVEIFDKIKDKDEYAIHFRYATHGEIDLDNCHPFYVTKDLILMHNGIMSEFGKIDSNKSDTRNFCEQFLRPYILQEGVEIIKDKQFIDDCGTVIGQGNKLLLIDKDFNWSIINEDSGVWLEDCWFSNAHPINSTHSYYKSYSKGYNAYNDDDYFFGNDKYKNDKNIAKNWNNPYGYMNPYTGEMEWD